MTSDIAQTQFEHDLRFKHRRNNDSEKTHWEGCWSEPGHELCVIGRLQHLETEITRLLEAAEDVCRDASHHEEGDCALVKLDVLERLQQVIS